MPEARTYGRRRALPAAEETTAPPVVLTGRVVATTQATDMGAWDAMEKIASASGSDLFLKIDEHRKIIKVVSDGPFDVFNSHWIEEISEGSKSIRCWGTSECPLCMIGDKPKKFSACFSVISLEDPLVPSLKVWEAGIKVARQLKEIATDAKRGPLNRSDLYFSISKIKKAKSIEYTLERVKERDLDEEFGIEPLDPSTLDAFSEQRHTESVKEPLDEKAMREIVDLLMEDA